MMFWNLCSNGKVLIEYSVVEKTARIHISMSILIDADADVRKPPARFLPTGIVAMSVLT